MILLLTVALAGVQANGIACLEPNETSSVAEHNIAWVCELLNWRNTLAGLKEQVERECFINNIGVHERWQSSFQCLDFSNIICMDDSLRENITDLFNCSIIFCKDGQYSDENALLGIWRQHFNTYKSILAVSKLIRCTQSECPDPTNFPEASKQDMTVFDLIKTSTAVDTVSSAISKAYSIYSTVHDVINTNAPNTNEKESNSGTTEIPVTTQASDINGASETPTLPHTTRAEQNLTNIQDCSEVDPKTFKSGNENCGVFEISIAGEKVDVSCDFITDGGKWTVIQRRMDGSINFYRNHNDYVTGFGDVSREFWMGLDNMYNILQTAEQFELRIDMEDWDGVSKFAKYSSISIGSFAQDYRISMGQYSGSAGDSFSYQNGGKFSTADHDVDLVRDQNCAVRYKGGWWYTTCHNTNLNGLYHFVGEHESFADGINWYKWRGFYYSLRFAEMKIRPIS